VLRRMFGAVSNNAEGARLDDDREAVTDRFMLDLSAV
jgi:hypothetical protein